MIQVKHCGSCDGKGQKHRLATYEEANKLIEGFVPSGMAWPYVTEDCTDCNNTGHQIIYLDPEMR